MATAQDGFTPLHFCSQAGCAEGCRLLLEAGAKADAKLNKNRKVGEYTLYHPMLYRCGIPRGAAFALIGYSV